MLTKQRIETTLAILGGVLFSIILYLYVFQIQSGPGQGCAGYTFILNPLGISLQNGMGFMSFCSDTYRPPNYTYLLWWALFISILSYLRIKKTTHFGKLAILLLMLVIVSGIIDSTLIRNFSN